MGAVRRGVGHQDFREKIGVDGDYVFFFAARIELCLITSSC